MGRDRAGRGLAPCRPAVSTQGATEARVTFASETDAVGAAVAAFRPDGTPATSLPAETDPTSGTTTLRFDTTGTDRLGIEVSTGASVWSPSVPVYLMSSEVR